MRQQTEVDFGEKWRKHRAVIVKKKTALLAALRANGQTFAKRFASQQVKDLLGMEAVEFFNPFFYEQLFDVIDEASSIAAGLRPTGPQRKMGSRDRYDEAAWRGAYADVARGSLHSLISEYVETGVVRWLTHSAGRDDPKTLPSSIVKEEYDNIANCVLAGLGEPNDVFTMLEQAVQTLHRCIIGRLSSLGPGAGHLNAGCFKDCATTAREALRPKLGSDVDPRSFLLLEETDPEPLIDEVVTINTTSPAFGIDPGKWREALASFRSPKWETSGRNVTVQAAFVPSGEAGEAKESRFHKVQAASSRTYVLIGNQLPEGDGTVSFQELPERFKELINLLTPLGGVFWLLRRDSEITMRNVTYEEVLTPCDALKKTLLGLACNRCEFIVCALDRYKLSERTAGE
jgi:hypothetical protein